MPAFAVASRRQARKIDLTLSKRSIFPVSKAILKGNAGWMAFFVLAHGDPDPAKECNDLYRLYFHELSPSFSFAHPKEIKQSADSLAQLILIAREHFLHFLLREEVDLTSKQFEGNNRALLYAIQHLFLHGHILNHSQVFY